MICIKCGAKIDDDARFCSICGESVGDDRPSPAARVSTEYADGVCETTLGPSSEDRSDNQAPGIAFSTTVICAACGEPLEAGDLFCTSCGTRAEGSKSERAATEASEQVANADPLAPSKEPTETGKIKLPKAGVVAIASSAVAIVVALVFFLVIAPQLGLFGKDSRSAGAIPSSSGASAGSTSVVEPKSTFADYSWSDISVISNELESCSSRADAIEVAKRFNIMDSAGKLKRGLTKSFVCQDGKQLSASVVGIMHDDKEGGSGKVGLTFITDQAVQSLSMNPTDTNAGGWNQSGLRSSLGAYASNTLPKELLSVIKKAKKYTNNTGVTESSSSVTATNDTLWVPSYQEVAGDIAYGTGTGYWDIYNAEGDQYELFAQASINESGANDVLVRNLASNNQPVTWWLRSPRTKFDTGFRHVLGNGNPDRGEGDNASTQLGVVFGFCV